MASNRRLRVGEAGRAAVYEFRGMATRILNRDADVDEALDLMAKFLREIEKKERERVETLLRRELGPRLSLPGRPPA